MLKCFMFPDIIMARKRKDPDWKPGFTRRRESEGYDLAENKKRNLGEKKQLQIIARKAMTNKLSY